MTFSASDLHDFHAFSTSILRDRSSMKSSGFEPLSDGVGDSGDSKRASMNGLLGESGVSHKMLITSFSAEFFFVHGLTAGGGAGTNFCWAGGVVFILCTAGLLEAALTSLERGRAGYSLAEDVRGGGAALRHAPLDTVGGAALRHAPLGSLGGEAALRLASRDAFCAMKANLAGQSIELAGWEALQLQHFAGSARKSPHSFEV